MTMDHLGRDGQHCGIGRNESYLLEEIDSSNVRIGRIVDDLSLEWVVSMGLHL